MTQAGALRPAKPEDFVLQTPSVALTTLSAADPSAANPPGLDR